MWCLHNSPLLFMMVVDKHLQREQAFGCAHDHMLTDFLLLLSQAGLSEPQAASADPRQDHLPSGPSPTLSTGCQISPAPYLGSNQSGSLLSTCSKPGTTTRPERVHMSLTARISSLRPDPMAKRRVQQCLGSDKNTYD